MRAVLEHMAIAAVITGLWLGLHPVARDVLGHGYATAAIATALCAGALLAYALFDRLLAQGPARARAAAGSAAAIALAALVAVGVVEGRDALRTQATTAALAEQQQARSGVSVDAVDAAAAVLRRNRDGHFIANALIDGVAIALVVDTGATHTVLPYETAARLGFSPNALRFNTPVMTANGPYLVARVRLGDVRIGSVRLANIEASVAPAGALPTALLGMSALSRLAEIRIAGDRLTLIE